MKRCMYSWHFWKAAWLSTSTFADIVGEVIAHGARHGHRSRGTPRKGAGRSLAAASICSHWNLEVVEIPLQLLDRSADAGGAHDGAHALRDLQAGS